MLHNAACAALCSAASAAPWMRFDTPEGNRRTANSSGEPTRLAMRALSVGASSSATARRRSAMSCGSLASVGTRSPIAQAVSAAPGNPASAPMYWR